MNICVIGVGYVGLTTAAVFADLGHTVYCIDKNSKRIEDLNKGIIPIYEPGLRELIQKNKSRLYFYDSIGKWIDNAGILLIAVGTPSLPDGSTNLSFIQSVIEDIAGSITSYKTIITKSTVPPGTNESIYQSLIEKGVDSNLFNIVSNPEFLREGTAIKDMLLADKIVVGIQENDTLSLPILKQLYKGIDAPFVVTNLNGAEMIKYASNAFLATKISFINEMARICDKYNVDITDVAKGIGSDPRIGPYFLQAGIGYGGSCFPKDVHSLEHTARRKNIIPHLLHAVQTINETQVDVYTEKIHNILKDTNATTIAVLGIAFKPNTDDTRYSAAVMLMERLSKLGYMIKAYDPKALLPKQILNTGQFAKLEDCISGADCIVIATEWDEFVSINWSYVKGFVKGNFVIDGRNCLNPIAVRSGGFHYIGVGRL